MPEAVTYRITTYYKLAKAERGLNQMTSTRIAASQAIDWIIADLPDNAITVEHDGDDKVTLAIDWSKVPDAVRWPKIPARRP